MRVDRALTVAVTGARSEVRVDGRAVPFAEPVSLRAGAVLAVGPARQGVRAYVAVSGGVAVPPVLGSRSRDTLAGVGPEPLRAGDVLPLGDRAGPPAPLDVAPPRVGDRTAAAAARTRGRTGWTRRPGRR